MALGRQVKAHGWDNLAWRGLGGTFIDEIERKECAVAVDIMDNIATALQVPLRDLVDPYRFVGIGKCVG